MNTDKGFSESKKAIGFCIGMVCMMVTYILGVKLGLSETLIQDLGMKELVATGVFVGGQAFVDMVKQALGLVKELKDLLTAKPGDKPAQG